MDCTLLALTACRARSGKFAYIIGYCPPFVLDLEDSATPSPGEQASEGGQGKSGDVSPPERSGVVSSQCELGCVADEGVGLCSAAQVVEEPAQAECGGSFEVGEGVEAGVDFGLEGGEVVCGVNPYAA